MLLVYPIGVPVLLLILLWRLSRTGALALETTRARLGFLYESYQLKYWWFEIFGELLVSFWFFL